MGKTHPERLENKVADLATRITLDSFALAELAKYNLSDGMKIQLKEALGKLNEVGNRI